MTTSHLLALGSTHFVLLLIAGGLFGMIAIVGIIFHYRDENNKRWHETARLALERGQPVPLPVAESLRTPGTRRNDIRSGLVTLAVGVALYVGFREMGASGPPIIAAYICLAVGMVQLLFGVFQALRKSKEGGPVSEDGRP